MQNQPNHTAPARARFPQLPALSPRTKLLLKIAGGIVGVLVVALIIVNLLISADWVRDRVAARIKEQTGRELKVNGTTALLFTPGPHVVITYATITDPQARAGTADLAIDRLVLDLNFSQLLSRQVDAERVVLVRPVLRLRLGKDDTAPAERSDAGEKRKHVVKADAGDEPKRDIRLKDVQIEDGTVEIVYDDKGTERRVEHIDASVNMPTLADPVTGTGKFDWKDQTVAFGIELTTPSDLREKRPARLVLSLDNPAIAARFEGNIQTQPSFSGQGELSAKVHSVPSLLAWMRERPPAATAIGDGELASKLSWTEQEVTFSEARFALEHASGQGQAVVTLQSPRPHVRAAFALDHLDLNPFLAGNAQGGKKPKKQRDESGGSDATPAEQAAPSADSGGDSASSDAPTKKGSFTKPGADQTAAADQQATPEASPPAPEAGGDAGQQTASQDEAPPTPPIPPAETPVAPPAAFDADVNLNVRQTRVAHLELGPTSLGLGFRDGILTATLGGMELYDGHATGKLVLDAAKPVPAFTGDFRLDGVEAKTLLSDAAQFSMLSGRTKLALHLTGAGSDSDAIKASLQGQGSLAVSDGAIEGMDLTSMISALGEGQIPNLRQGPGAKTAFSDLGGSFTIASGIVETSNLKMTSPLLKVAATGQVDLVQSTIDMLANPEIVAGAEGKGGANDLAGLSVPIRIEGPLEAPKIKPEIKGMFASPEQANKQIGEVIKKKFKGKPMGEALGRLLGGVQIGPRGGGNDGGAETGEAEPPAKQKQSSKPPPQQAEPAPEAGGNGEGDNAPDEPDDPDLDRILR